eukprot:gene9628-9705_t
MCIAGAIFALAVRGKPELQAGVTSPLVWLIVVALAYEVSQKLLPRLNLQAILPMQRFAGYFAGAFTSLTGNAMSRMGLSMAQSRLMWAIRTVSPYCVATAMLVSFTATAGQDSSFGGMRALLTDRAAAQPEDLIPASRALSFGAFKLPGLPNGAVLRSAKLVIGDTSQLPAVPDEAPPRHNLKRSYDAANIPVVDRHLKGAPFVGLRPSFDAQLRHPGALSALGLLNRADFQTLASSFADETARSDVSRSLNESGGTGLHANAQDTPTTIIKIHTPTNARSRAVQGATPAVPRAIALGSTTPALPDSVPVEVAFAAPGKAADSQQSIVPRDAGQPDYLAQVGGDALAREEKCLAEAVYFEARSESEQGQAAVAQVVLNRMISGLYPTTICGVVYQNRTHYMACQFSFACEGKSLRTTEAEPWALAQKIAKQVLQGKTYLAAVGGATHYHATYVRPYWAKSLKKMDKIGTHIFYKLRPESLFSDSLRIGPDISHSQLEQRFRAIDQTANRRHIFVVFMFRHQEAGILIRPINDEAEAFVDEADLSNYDFSDMNSVQFELRPKDKSVSLRLPEGLLNEVGD